MSDEQATASIPQRVLVALDASPHSRAALDAAVRLAAVFEAELEGLFVEDETLVRAARLSVVQEVRAYTAPPRRLDDQRLQRQLRRQAERAEYALRRAAQSAEVPHDFDTVRGDVTEELLRAAADTDLLVLGKTSRTSSRRRLGSTSRTLLAEAESSVLVLREPLVSPSPLLVYYDGTARAEAALALGIELAGRSEDGRLEVALPASDDGEAKRLRNRIRTSADDLSLRIRALSWAEGRRLSAFVRHTEGLVLLPAGGAPLRTTALQQTLYELNRPVLVVR
jgi:nucleotide-binding universal stress UspA family protein